MKYTSEYINSISFPEYLELMAKELNDNGFKERGKYEYQVDDEPAFQRLFMMGPVNDSLALSHLKRVGLLENGRCPSCGAPMSQYRFTWYDRKDPSKKFYVCYGCSKSNGHGDGHSMDGAPHGVLNSSQFGTGCIFGLLLLPFYLLKSIL